MRGVKPHPAPGRALVDCLIKEASEETGVSESDIRGFSSSKHVSPGRHMTWRKLKAEGFGASAISRAWGCHPSTVQTALYGKPSAPLRPQDVEIRGKPRNVASPLRVVGGNLST